MIDSLKLAYNNYLLLTPYLLPSTSCILVGAIEVYNGLTVVHCEIEKHVTYQYFKFSLPNSLSTVPLINEASFLGFKLCNPSICSLPLSNTPLYRPHIFLNRKLEYCTCQKGFTPPGYPGNAIINFNPILIRYDIE